MKTQVLEHDTLKQTVRERYARIVAKGGSCGCSPNCWSSEDGTQDNNPKALSQALGYSYDPCLRCGNPQAIAALTPGGSVLDLGGGAGIDAFLAARDGWAQRRN